MSTARRAARHVPRWIPSAVIATAVAALSPPLSAQTLPGERVVWRPVGAIGFAAGATLTSAAVAHLVARFSVSPTFAPPASFYVPFVGPVITAFACRANGEDFRHCDAIAFAGILPMVGEFVGLGLFTAFLISREPWFVPDPFGRDSPPSAIDTASQFEPRRASRIDDGSAPTVGMRRHWAPFWPLVLAGATVWMATHVTSALIGIALVDRDATSLLAAVPVVGPTLAAVASEPCRSPAGFGGFECAINTTLAVLASLGQVTGPVLLGFGLRARSSWIVPDVGRGRGAHRVPAHLALLPTAGAGSLGLQVVGAL